VVLIHGFIGDLTHTQPLAERLNARGYRTLTFDNVGRGWSSCPGEPHVPELFVAQITSLLAALEISQPVHVLGVSMGAGIAAKFAQMHPGHTKSLALLCPAGIATTGVPPSVVTSVPLLLETVLLFKLGQSALPSEQGFVDEQHPGCTEMARHHKSRLAEPSEYTLLVLSMVLGLRYYPFTDMRSVYQGAAAACSSPKIIVQGDLDETTELQGAVELEKVLGADLHVIKGAGHAVYAEFEEEVVGLVAAMYDRIAIKA